MVGKRWGVQISISFTFFNSSHELFIPNKTIRERDVANAQICTEDSNLGDYIGV